MTDKEIDNKVNDNVNNEQRTTVHNLQLKILLINTQLELIQQRRNAITLEMDVLPVKTNDLQKRRKELVVEFKDKYEKLKSIMNVPDNSELDLETGKIVPKQTPL